MTHFRRGRSRSDSGPFKDPPSAAAGNAAEHAVSGLLDVAGSSAFVRTSGFQPGPDDVFVPAALIKQYGLRRGDQIDGAARPPGASGPARRRGPQREARNRGPQRPGP